MLTRVSTSAFAGIAACAALVLAPTLPAVAQSPLPRLKVADNNRLQDPFTSRGRATSGPVHQ